MPSKRLEHSNLLTRTAESIVAEGASPRWIVLGQATLDWGGGLVGPMVSEFLGYVLVDHIVEVAPDGDRSIRCQRLLDGGSREEIRVASPAVLTISAMAFRPTVSPVRARMRAQRAAIEEYAPAVREHLPRPSLSRIARPGPRPKSYLPPDFGSLAPEDRLALLLRAEQPARRGSTLRFEGNPTEVAARILDYVEEAGLDWKKAYQRFRRGVEE